VRINLNSPVAIESRLMPRGNERTGGMIIKLLALNPPSWDLRGALSDRSICFPLFSGQSCAGCSFDLIVHSISLMSNV
jgi:hypothetical protein